jgi:hypothetical protein
MTEQGITRVVIAGGGTGWLDDSCRTVPFSGTPADDYAR